MDNSLHQQESETQQKRGLFTGMWIFESILSRTRQSLNWLAGFLKLTEEEQENAGVYLGRLGDE